MLGFYFQSRSLSKCFGYKDLNSSEKPQLYMVSDETHGDQMG